MKNLSFALALALICISMFSCGEKSVITPLDEDFKITTFSPISGFTASEVTLLGENLTKDSIVSVAFGEQTTEILSRSSDSVIVKVPDIAYGQYDILVKTKTKSYVYEKKYEVLQNDFKITSFYPLSNFAKSQITLYGEHLNKYSDLIIKVGDQTVEILSKSNDSITIKIPNIESGFYDISINVKSKSFVYDTKFEVLNRPLIDDLTQIKNYSVSITGFRVKYKKYSEYQEADPTKHGSSTSFKTDTAFSMVHHNKYSIIISEDGTDKYKGLEKTDNPYGQDGYSIHFQIDKINKKFIALNINCSDHKETPYEFGTITYENNLKFDLSNVKYEVNNELSIISIKVKQEDIIPSLNNFYFSRYNGYVYTYGNRYTKGTDTFIELLGINEDATIEIKFTK